MKNIKPTLISKVMVNSILVLLVAQRQKPVQYDNIGSVSCSNKKETMLSLKSITVLKTKLPKNGK